MSIVNGVKIATLVSAANGDTYGDGERHQFRTWQALVQPNVKGLNLSVQPSSPSNGDMYVVAAYVGASSPTGTQWPGNTNNIAYYAVDPQDGTSISSLPCWEFYTPIEGWQVYDINTHMIWRFNGTSWLWKSFSGTATVSSSTSVAVTFPAIYGGTAAPIITITPTSNPTSGVGFAWVTYSGVGGAWTGFTINVATSGTMTYNYVING